MVRLDSEMSEEFEVKVRGCAKDCAVTFSFCSGGRCCHRICQRRLTLSCIYMFSMIIEPNNTLW